MKFYVLDEYDAVMAMARVGLEARKPFSEVKIMRPEEQIDMAEVNIMASLREGFAILAERERDKRELEKILR